MSKLLIDDYPILVLPKLAEQIGLNEAIVLQQMHYWLTNSKHYHDGCKWIYNTYKDWKEQFPFWSDRTIRRTITSLENQKLIITGNYNKAGFDKTKWYSVDYEMLELVDRRCGQNDQTHWSNRPHGIGQNDQVEVVKMDKPIPEINTEITSETSTDNNMSGNPTYIPYKEIIDYLNEKTGKRYSHKSKANQKLIKARINEDNSKEDFFTVIDNMVAQWKGNSKMEKYLRPKTLFSGNFDNYKNQTPKDQSNENNPYANAFDNAKQVDIKNLPF